MIRKISIVALALFMIGNLSFSLNEIQAKSYKTYSSASSKKNKTNYKGKKGKKKKDCNCPH